MTNWADELDALSQERIRLEGVKRMAAEEEDEGNTDTYNTSFTEGEFRDDINYSLSEDVEQSDGTVRIEATTTSTSTSTTSTTSSTAVTTTLSMYHIRLGLSIT